MLRLPLFVLITIITIAYILILIIINTLPQLLAMIHAPLQRGARLTGRSIPSHVRRMCRICEHEFPVSCTCMPTTEARG